MSLLKSHLWPACRLPYPHPRPQTSTNVSSNIAPLAALPSHPPPGPSPGPGHHDHPRLWLLGALSSQKARLSLCSAADCAKHIEYEGFRPQPLQNSRKSTALQDFPVDPGWPHGGRMLARAVRHFEDILRGLTRRGGLPSQRGGLPAPQVQRLVGPRPGRLWRPHLKTRCLRWGRHTPLPPPTPRPPLPTTTPKSCQNHVKIK